MVSEPNKDTAKRRGWLTDRRKDVALVFVSRRVQIGDNGDGDGYVRAELAGITVYARYCSPNVGMETFDAFITGLGEDVRRRGGPVIVGGDFNAKAHEWGSPTEDHRGSAVMEWVSGADLMILNRGSRPTFERGCQRSFIDITVCTSGISHGIRNWRVEREEILGDHNLIVFEYRRRKQTAPQKGKGGWRVSAERLDDFTRVLVDRLDKERAKGWRPEYGRYLECVEASCEETFPKRNQMCGNKKAVHWWSQDVKKCREACLRKRRIMTRTNRNGTQDERRRTREEYKESRNIFKRATRLAKKESWSALLEDLNRDEWGNGYRLVIKKMCGKGGSRLSDDKQWAAAEELFPQVADREGGENAQYEPDGPPFTEEELIEAAGKIKANKAPACNRQGRVEWDKGRLPEHREYRIS